MCSMNQNYKWYAPVGVSMEANQTTDEPSVTRTDEFELNEAVDQISELPNTRVGTKGKVWATFHTDSEEVPAVCEIAFKNRDVVMWNAKRKEGRVSIALKKFEDEL